MSDAALIDMLRRQEAELVFPQFDEAVAFALGSAIRERGVRESLGIVCEIRLWNRPLFYMALPRTNGDNSYWARRKAHVVERWGKSSYRAFIENKRERQFTDRSADPKDYALSGGAFPIVVAGIGQVGTIAISGLHEADDHRVVVEAICDHLKLDRSQYTLPQ